MSCVTGFNANDGIVLLSQGVGILYSLFVSGGNFWTIILSGPSESLSWTRGGSSVFTLHQWVCICKPNLLVEYSCVTTFLLYGLCVHGEVVIKYSVVFLLVIWSRVQ